MIVVVPVAGEGGGPTRQPLVEDIVVLLILGGRRRRLGVAVRRRWYGGGEEEGSRRRVGSAGPGEAFGGAARVVVVAASGAVSAGASPSCGGGGGVGEGGVGSGVVRGAGKDVGDDPGQVVSKHAAGDADRGEGGAGRDEGGDETAARSTSSCDDASTIADAAGEGCPGREAPAMREAAAAGGAGAVDAGLEFSEDGKLRPRRRDDADEVVERPRGDQGREVLRVRSGQGQGRDAGVGEAVRLDVPGRPRRVEEGRLVGERPWETGDRHPLVLRAARDGPEDVVPEVHEALQPEPRHEVVPDDDARAEGRHLLGQARVHEGPRRRKRHAPRRRQSASFLASSGCSLAKQQGQQRRHSGAEGVADHHDLVGPVALPRQLLDEDRRHEVRRVAGDRQHPRVRQVLRVLL
mmetsp:Transcript_33528/g.107100  ORF Transcript_33528/g.107100 Transcript_33528/m.107100 type:complete len:407 (+) Transcript_33528:388-1608(+)